MQIVWNMLGYVVLLVLVALMLVWAIEDDL
jgi:hypothetical protein